MVERIDKQRRRLCGAACAGSGLIVLSTVPGCGGTADGKTSTASCTIGSPGAGAADLAVGEARFDESLSVFVCRDSTGYYALDSQCTHVGTDINFVSASAGFLCPAHGSTFDFDGNVTKGPALLDLPHYELCTTESGLLIVDQSKQVTADTRLLV